MEKKERLRELKKDKFDAIIIGSGIGGLTAGALLAKKGWDVLICEKHYIPGGSSSYFKRPGYIFDVGLHYVGEYGPDGIISKILRLIDLEVEFNLLDLQCFDQLLFPEFSFCVSADLEQYRTNLLELFPEEKRGIDRYIKMLRRAWQLVTEHQDAPLKKILSIWKYALPLRYLFATLESFYDSCTKNPKLRAVWSGNQIIYAQPPSRVAALVHILGTMHYMSGPCYPKGGGHVLSERIVQRFEELGGTLLLRTEVKRIKVSAGRVTGAVIENPHLGERELSAPVIISNADYKRTFLELVGAQNLPKKLVKKLQQAEMSPGLGVVYLGIERNPSEEPLPKRNYVIFPEYDIEPFYQSLFKGEFYPNPWCCITVASAKDPENTQLAPPDAINAQLMIPVPSQPSAWGVTEEELFQLTYRKNEKYLEKKQKFADSLIELAQQVYPNLRNRIKFMEVSTPLTHWRYTGASGGTAYGLALTPRYFFIRRPEPKTPIRGLFLCGASTRSGHGIPGAMLSGVDAVSSILPAREKPNLNGEW